MKKKTKLIVLVVEREVMTAQLSDILEEAVSSIKGYEFLIVPDYIKPLQVVDPIKPSLLENLFGIPRKRKVKKK